jgi:hypothetical protein
MVCWQETNCRSSETSGGNPNTKVALELANADTLENAKINHQKSIEYLKKNF